jgi:hypothetical protein
MGVEVKLIFTQAEYNKLLRATVESGRKLPRTFAHEAVMEKVDAAVGNTQGEKPLASASARLRVEADPRQVDLSHLVSDAGAPATPSVGSNAG